MYAKLYAAVWVMLFVVAGALALTGNFTTTTAITFGFISFGMIFMGMMSVLPSIVSTPEGRSSLCESPRRPAETNTAVHGGIRNSVYNWLFPRRVETGRPHFH
jgi:hypothetical protein